MPAAAEIGIAKQGRAFLEQNQEKEGVIVTKSGLQYKILAPGSDKKPTSRSRVTIHFQGKHVDNRVFDSTFNDEPLELSLRKAIRGWKEGLPLIGEGGRIVDPLATARSGGHRHRTDTEEPYKRSGKGAPWGRIRGQIEIADFFGFSGFF